MANNERQSHLTLGEVMNSWGGSDRVADIFESYSNISGFDGQIGYPGRQTTFFHLAEFLRNRVDTGEVAVENIPAATKYALLQAIQAICGPEIVKERIGIQLQGLESQVFEEVHGFTPLTARSEQVQSAQKPSQSRQSGVIYEAKQGLRNFGKGLIENVRGRQKAKEEFRQNTRMYKELIQRYRGGLKVIESHVADLGETVQFDEPRLRRYDRVFRWNEGYLGVAVAERPVRFRKSRQPITLKIDDKKVVITGDLVGDIVTDRVISPQRALATLAKEQALLKTIYQGLDPAYRASAGSLTDRMRAIDSAAGDLLHDPRPGSLNELLDKSNEYITAKTAAQGALAFSMILAGCSPAVATINPLETEAVQPRTEQAATGEESEFGNQASEATVTVVESLPPSPTQTAENSGKVREVQYPSGQIEVISVPADQRVILVEGQNQPNYDPVIDKITGTNKDTSVEAEVNLRDQIREQLNQIYEVARQQLGDNLGSIEVDTSRVQWGVFFYDKQGNGYYLELVNDKENLGEEAGKPILANNPFGVNVDWQVVYQREGTSLNNWVRLVKVDLAGARAAIDTSGGWLVWIGEKDGQMMWLDLNNNQVVSLAILDGQELAVEPSPVPVTVEANATAEIPLYTIQQGVLMRWNGDKYEYISMDNKPILADLLLETNLGLMVKHGGQLVTVFETGSEKQLYSVNGLIRKDGAWYYLPPDDKVWQMLPIDGNLTVDQIINDNFRTTILQPDPRGYAPIVVFVIENDTGNLISVKDYQYESGNDLFYYVEKSKKWIKAPPMRTDAEYFQLTRQNIGNWYQGKYVIDEELKFRDGEPMPFNIWPNRWPPPMKGAWQFQGVLLGYMPHKGGLVEAVGVQVDGQNKVVLVKPYQEVDGLFRYYFSIRSQQFKQTVSASRQNILLSQNQIMRVMESYLGKPVLLIVKRLSLKEDWNIDYCDISAGLASNRLGEALFKEVEDPLIDFNESELEELTPPCVSGVDISVIEIEQ